MTPHAAKMKPSTLKLLVFMTLTLPSASVIGNETIVPMSDDREILKIIEAKRLGLMAAFPLDFNPRFGATHSDGKYHLTAKPFLIEGAAKLLEIGTQLGKFWFSPDAAKQFYSFNIDWPETSNLVDLANSDYFQQVWKMPFRTIFPTTSAPSEQGRRKPGQPA
jgi:hypothetical protein